MTTPTSLPTTITPNVTNTHAADSAIVNAAVNALTAAAAQPKSASDLTTGTLAAARIADGSIPLAKLAENIATQAELDAAVLAAGGGGTDASALTTGTLAAARIADGSLPTTKLSVPVATVAALDAAIAPFNAAGNVTTTDIASAAVTLPKLGADVTAAFASATDPRFVAAGGDRKPGAFTLDLTHAGDIVEVDSPTAVTVTVPPATSVAWPDHAQIKLRQVGAGQVTVAPGSGVTLRIADAGLKTPSQYKAVLLDRRPAGSVTATAPPTANLLARFRADDLTGANGSAVSSWPDISGNIPALAQATAANQPLIRTGVNGINNRKTVAFDSINDYLAFSGAGLALAQNRAALTVVIVYRYATAQSGARSFLSLSVNSGTTTRRMNVDQRTTAGAFMAGARIKDTDAGAFLTSSNSASSTVGAAGVLAVQFDYTNGFINFHKDGAVQGTPVAFQTASKGVTDNTPSLGGWVGSNLGVDSFLGGEIAEILFYNTIATSLLPSVDTYIQDFYSITMADSSGAIGDEWVVEGGVA